MPDFEELVEVNNFAENIFDCNIYTHSIRTFYH